MTQPNPNQIPELDHPGTPADGHNTSAAAQTSLVRVHDEVLATLDEPETNDYFGGAFTIDFPENIPEHARDSDEASNQKRMAAIRVELEKSPTGKQYAWVPQAIEAARRVLGTEFGTIRGVEFDPHEGQVSFRTQSDTHNIRSGDITFSLEDLRSFSLDQLVQEREGAEGESGIEYSPEMLSAIEGLSEDARYRWNLIARAAHLIDSGKGQGENERLFASLVTPSVYGMPNGVGIFSDSPEREKYAKKFSLVKVVAEDIPWTAREKEIIERGEGVDSIKYTYAPLREFINNFASLANRFSDATKGQSRVEKLTQGAQRLAGRDTINSLNNELDALWREMDAHSSRCIKIADEVRKYLLNAKTNSKGSPHPFETEKLPDELEKRVADAAATWTVILQKITAFMQKKNEALSKFLPEVETPGDDVPLPNHTGPTLKERTRAFVSSFGPGSSNTIGQDSQKLLGN